MNTTFEAAPEALESAPEAGGDVRMIDLCGRRLAVSCSGERSPTVILETGLGAESADWAAVQAGLEGSVRVFHYDRAGRGQSDPAHTPRTARAMVEDLRRLLERADVTGPYVLVGHSYGGLLMRLFAHHYPEEVAGLVLVDSMHEDQFAVFGPTFPPAMPGEPASLSEMRAFWTEGWRDPASTVEGIDFPTSLDQGRAITSLGDLPLRVITAGTYLNQTMVPPPVRPMLQGLWNGLQARFLSLSTNVEQTFVDHSSHFVQRDDPGAVVEVVRRLVAQVRR